VARWWVISEEELLAALQRVEAGDPAGVVLVELYANSDTERVEPDA
jgi:hypothetical protein